MIKLLFYIGILIGLCYVLDYFYLKSKESIRELRQAYKEFKEAEHKLRDLFR
jgi:uncharacterized membrane protein YciS (DUF1049 family)